MNFKIYAPLQMQFASMILCDNLNKLGRKAEIVPKLDPTDDKHIWIIYNNSLSWDVPKHYISYQTEQKGTHWFNDRYYERLSKSIAVWEYNEYNIEAYQHLNDNISIVSPGIKQQPKIHKDIDCLFYGDLSPRRIEAVSKIDGMMIIKRKLGEPMRNLLSRAKVVVNIHYYDTSPLETFRLNEALSHNCHVVSEHSIFGDNKYKDVVRFGNVDELNELRKGFGEFNYDLSSFNNLEQIKEALSKI